MFEPYVSDSVKMLCLYNVTSVIFNTPQVKQKGAKTFFVKCGKYAF